MNSTLAGLSRDLDSERTTSEALTAGAFAAIDAPDGEGERAFTEVDRQPARAVAAAVELWCREAGHALPLAGIPVSKDLFDVGNAVTRAGALICGARSPAQRTR